MIPTHPIKLEDAIAVVLNARGETLGRIKVKGAWMGESGMNFVPTQTGHKLISKALNMDFIGIEKRGWSIRYDRA